MSDLMANNGGAVIFQRVDSFISGLSTKRFEWSSAVCKIYECNQDKQDDLCGSGVLVNDPNVNNPELSKYCIITSSKVIENAASGTYRVEFSMSSKKSKGETFNLSDIKKIVKSDASEQGLVMIFIHDRLFKRKFFKLFKSTISSTGLTIERVHFGQDQQPFCFFAKQRYNIKIDSEKNGKYLLEAANEASTRDAPPEKLLHGTVILQGAEGNEKAVGIFNGHVVDKTQVEIYPIWFESTITDILENQQLTDPTVPEEQRIADEGHISASEEERAETPAPPKEPEIPANFEPDGPSPSPAGSVTANAEIPAPPKEPEIPANLEPDGPPPSPAGSVTANVSSTVQTDGKPQTQTTSESVSSGDTPDKLELQMNIENVPNSQEVVNAITSRYLQCVRPSNTEEFNDFKQYLTDERKVRIVDTQPGSLIVTVRCSSLQILEELWQDYRSGHLNEMAQKCLVTNEILTKFGLKEAKLTTTILEKEYRTCREYFLELLVADQSVSKEVTNNDLLLEKLSRKLDRERRHIQCWKHLAFVLDVPPEERRKFDRYTEHSPTEDMFNYLDDAGKADLKVKDLKTKLKAIYRNDVIKRLNEEKYDDETRVSELLSRDDGKFIGMLSSKLDTGMNGWKLLASQFEIKHERTVQFGLPGPGPTAELFLYMSTTDYLKDLTIGELREHFEAMEQIKLVNILPKDKDSSLVTKEVAADSDLLEAIGKCLNKNIRGVNNWRKLACRLKIPFDDYDAFDASKEVERELSPTKMLFTWLENGKPKLTVKDLLNCLRKIKRFDVVELVMEEVAVALKKKKTQVYLTEQALYKLQLLRHHTDLAKKDKNVLLADLREKAVGQGLTLIDNDGLGNCMFSALCHQLKIKKRLKQYSEMELRTELAQYLKAHPELNDFVDQKEYPTWTDYVNKMASNGHWGDGVTLLAAARHLHCDVRVISNRDYPDVFLKPDSSNCDGEQLVQLVLGHIFEDHFVSLEPVH